MCVLVITATADALPFALCLPSLYSIYSDRLPKRIYAVIVALTPVLLIVFPGFTQSVILYLCLLACGIILNKFMNGGNFGLAVIIPSCLVFLLFLVGIYYAADQKGIAPQAMIGHWVAGVADQMSSLYARTLSPDAYNEFKLTRSVMERHIVQLFWGISASSIMSVMWINLLIAKSARKELRLRDWKCPDLMVGFFILAGVLILMQYDLARLVGLNLMIVVAQIYFFQGLAVVSTALIEYDWSKFIRGVIYVLILTQIYIMIGVAALGLFDTWFSFRNKIRNTKGEEA